MADPADASSAGANSAGGDSAGGDSAGADPAGADPLGANPVGDGPAGANPVGDSTAGANPVGDSPAAADPAGDSTAGAKPAGDGPRRRKWKRLLAEMAVIVVVAGLLAGLVRGFVFQTFWIPSASMTPTLGVYDRVLVQKAFFSWHDVREGDIVVFTHPPHDTCPGAGDLVKRVIALPGQTIYSSGNNIYINGKLLAEPYLPHNDPLGPPIASRQHPYRVPAGDFYVLGDNRSDSCDSRFWGPITGSSIIGKVVLVWWHDGHPDFHTF